VVRGQFCYTFVPYATENLQLWRPAQYDASQTAATDFRIAAAGQDAFARAVPLYAPKLETNEEFVVMKAKRRPVIVVSPAPPDPGIPAPRGTRIYRRMALVIPVFSLVDTVMERLKFPESFIDRVRTLEFPEFFYLPREPGVLPVPSLARLAELRAVFEPHLEPLDLRLRDDVRGIVEGHLRLLMTGVSEGDFHAYREQLLHPQGTAPRDRTNAARSTIVHSLLALVSRRAILRRPGDAAHRDGQHPRHHLTCPVGDTFRDGRTPGQVPVVQVGEVSMKSCYHAATALDPSRANLHEAGR